MFFSLADYQNHSHFASLRALISSPEWLEFLKYKQHNKQTLKLNGYFKSEVTYHNSLGYGHSIVRENVPSWWFPRDTEKQTLLLTKKERRKKTYYMYNVQCKVNKFSFYLTSLVIFSSNRNNFLMTELSCHFLKLLQLFGKL